MFSPATLTAIALLSSIASAWLPHDKDIRNSAGRNLFQTKYVGGNSTGVWLPGITPIRGVNLGSQFIVEPWMASTSWKNMGCGGLHSENDCVSSIGQQAANAAFTSHWSSWITQADIQQMASYTLNTIRIPLGYWIFEDIKAKDEYFPEGALQYLGSIVGWAADAGFYIILDLHGAPAAQDFQQPFTGQYVDSIDTSNPAWYQTSQYQRSYWFFGNLTNLIHTDKRYRNVGMVELVNEPIRSTDITKSMRSEYYPNAYATIRNVEKKLGVSPANYLHIQMMDSNWGSGNPTQYLTDLTSVAFDDHSYIAFSSTNPDQTSYLKAACQPRPASPGPLVVGEWSMAVNSSYLKASQFYPVANNLAFYKAFFARQARTFELQAGWVFWSWKTDQADPRWDYSAAVAAGVIPKILDTMSPAPCRTALRIPL